MPELENKEVNLTEDVELDENTGTEAAAEVTNEEKKYSQADIDAIIEKRLQRERKKAERDAAKAKEAEKAKEDSDELIALKKLLKAKDEKIIRQEAIKTAAEMGIDKDFIDAAVALADLTELELDNNGEVDVDELKETLKNVIDKYPRFLIKKEESESPKGFIKAGTEQKKETPASKIEEQIRKAMGL